MRNRPIYTTSVRKPQGKEHLENLGVENTLFDINMGHGETWCQGEG
jgi:hypothetical protein